MSQEVENAGYSNHSYENDDQQEKDEKSKNKQQGESLPSTSNAIDNLQEDCSSNETVDDIGVTLDYEPPMVTTIYQDTESVAGESPNSNARSQTNASRRERRRRRLAQERENVGLISFFTQHWFGQCTAAFLFGLVFLVVGVVFIVTQASIYVGVLFAVISICPFFMALNFCRTARRTEMLRRQAIERRNAIRRLRQQQRESRSHRRRHLPYSEHPPFYENLELNREEEPAWESRSRSSSTSTCSSEIDPPSYDEAWEEDKDYEMETDTVELQNSTSFQVIEE